MKRILIAALMTTVLAACGSQAPKEPSAEEKVEALEQRLDGLDSKFERLNTKLDRLIEHLESEQSDG